MAVSKGISKNKKFKDNLFQAFRVNLGEDYVDENPDTVDQLAEDLAFAIKLLVVDADFTIVEAEMSQTLTNVQGIPNAGGPVAIAVLDITTAISDKGQKPCNLKAGGKIESMKSLVKADKHKLELA